MFAVACPDIFEFCGNGTRWIAGKNPDFVRIDGKKKQVIEFFGDYWHSESITGIPEDIHEKQRSEHFENYGYDCLIIWETELNKQRSSIYHKVRRFAK